MFVPLRCFVIFSNSIGPHCLSITMTLSPLRVPSIQFLPTHSGNKKGQGNDPNQKSFWFLNKFSLLAVQKMNRENYRESAHYYHGFKIPFPPHSHLQLSFALLPQYLVQRLISNPTRITYS